MDVHCIDIFILLCLSSLKLYGVFGVEVSVMEGASVTLHTEVIKQKDDAMLWIYGPENDLVAKINGKVDSTKYYDGEDGRFRDRVMLDAQTGDLTISNFNMNHSGHYTLKINRNNKVSYKRFSVNAYSPLPIPTITRDSSSKCSVLCSVLNVSHVSLSWYKGSSLLSSISVSDLNIRLSLPLEVDYEDTNTHTCVLNNTITNHTQQLHINEVCEEYRDFPTKMVIFTLLIFMICIPIICVCIRKRAGDKSSLPDGIAMNEKKDLLLSHTEKGSNSSHTENTKSSDILNNNIATISFTKLLKVTPLQSAESCVNGQRYIWR